MNDQVISTFSLAATPRPWDSSGAMPAVAERLFEATRWGNDLKSTIGAIVRDMGFDGFDFLRYKRAFDDLGSDWNAWGASPNGWLDRYREKNYVVIDPLQRAAMLSPVPFCWGRDTFADALYLREFFVDAARFGVNSGISLAIPQRNPGQLHFLAVYSSATTTGKLLARSIASRIGDLWALAAYGHKLVLDSGAFPCGSENTPAALSRRELECLALAARGKTSAVIASDLGIAERTVNAHIESAIRKWGAKNRNEAVARGISSGIIAS